MPCDIAGEALVALMDDADAREVCWVGMQKSVLAVLMTQLRRYAVWCAAWMTIHVGEHDLSKMRCV